MKSIRRPKVWPPTLRRGGKGDDEAGRRETTFQASHRIEDVNADFEDHWGNPDVRGALWAMQGRSCAYCDRELPGNDRGDVEHFRPKNIYWWLAYNFENYLLSCSVCNSSYKKNKFPILPRHKAYDYSKKNQLAQERRALIDPVADAVDGWLGIDFDAERAKRKGFQITISPGLAKTETLRCNSTIEFFKLNIDSELLKARLVAMHAALTLAEKAIGGDNESRRELQQRAVRFCPHSFAVRQVIVSHAQRPEYLPSNDDEVAWLVEELLTMLRFALNALDERPNDTTETNQRDRCAWALAVLMKDPPGLSAGAVRARLEEEKVLAIVEPFYNRI